MPQLDFFFTDTEMIAFAEYVLDCGFVFVPDTNFDNSEPIICRYLDAILEFVPRCGHWFLLRNDYTFKPFRFHRIDGGKYEGKYSVDQRNGGPYIDLGWSRELEAKGVRFIAGGDIGHYPWFWNWDTESGESVPDTLRAAYAELKKYVVKNSVICDSPKGKRKYRFGKEAARRWKYEGLRFGHPDRPWDDPPKYIPE